ncbi:UNVERIFIED_CONTAM: hypothetical protein RMT77_014387 [Armadillidium vulgare]
MKLILIIFLLTFCNASKLSSLHRIERQAQTTNPEPTNLDPTNSKPTNPEPTNSKPTNSEPKNPEPTNSESTNSEPTNSGPTNSDSTNSEPTNPESTNPKPINSESPNPEDVSSAREEYLAQTFEGVFADLKASIKDPQTFEFKKKNYTVTGLSIITLAGKPTFNVRRRGNREVIVAKFNIGPLTFKGGNIVNPVQGSASGLVQIKIVKKEEEAPSIAVNNLRLNQVTRKDLEVQEHSREEAASALAFARHVISKRKYGEQLSEAFKTVISTEVHKGKLSNIPDRANEKAKKGTEK